ncbi:vWA domain-containing protein [Pyxidicoccus trucidator]|uniref:vWA domain-containing protein n=1 Tax=Pyxidicoccus trucidator TaxID=2709662 RepID=UPI0013DCB486|nr:vWA domain-containing protein [Pyxidicoccus trucidator]
MKRSLKQLLMCALAVPMISACGAEGDAGADTPSQPEPAPQAQPLVAEEPVKVMEVPSDGSRTQLVQAEESFGDPRAELAPGDKLGMILIDRSGSMGTVRTSTSNTRCVDAIRQARIELDKLFDEQGRTHVAVWSFHGATTTKHTKGYVSRATAHAAINSVETLGCTTENTPLADAMCWAIDNLSIQEAGQVTNLYIATDGYENSSNSTPCIKNATGVKLPSGDPLTSGTWQNAVYNQATTKLVKTSTSYWVSATDLEFAPSGQTDFTATATCSGVAACEDKLFSALAAVSGGEYRRAKDNNTAYPCSSSTSCPMPYTGTTGNKYTFSVSGTNNATVNTANQGIYLLAGETLTVGTCGVTGASATGDTSMRLFGLTGTEVAASDDGCGLLSKITYTAPATGTYQVRVGCFANNPCSGTAAYTISGAFNYSAANTSNATVNTTNRPVYLRPGQRIQVGTCTVPGSSGVGDTFLRLFGSTGTQVALNDQACGNLSYISYLVPTTGAGQSEVRAGCFSSLSCSGTVSYLLTDSSVP